MKHLSVGGFYGCCGISIVSGFLDLSNSDFNAGDRKLYHDRIVDDLEKGVAGKVGTNQGMWMIVLASYQKKYWEPELLKRGWSKVVSGAKSNMHGNSLYTYVKILHPATSDPDVLGDQ